MVPRRGDIGLMLRKALTLAGKDIKLAYRDRGALIGSYVAPVFVLFIFGVIFSGLMGGSEDISIDLLFVDEENSESSRRFLDNLSDEDVFTIHTTIDEGGEEIILTEEIAREMILDGDAYLALIYRRTEPHEDFSALDRPVLSLF